MTDLKLVENKDLPAAEKPEAPQAVQQQFSPEPELIKMLEQLLVMAKKGALREACVVYNGPVPGDAMFISGHPINAINFVGFLEHTKTKLLGQIQKALTEVPVSAQTDTSK